MSGSGPTERLAFTAPSPSPLVATSGVRAATAFGPASAPPAEPPAGAATSRQASAATPDEGAFRWSLLFTAVLFLRPQDIVPALGALHLAEVSAAAGLIALFASRLSRRETLTRVTPELIGVIALGAVIVLTAPFSIWMGGALGVFQDLYIKVILVYLLAVNVLTTPKRLEQFTWLLVLALGYIGFRAVLDFVRGTNLVGHGTRVRGSVGGIIENPNDLAMNMVAFLPLAAFFALQPGSVIKRLLGALAAVFMLGATVASGSRGGFLGFAAMVLVFGLFAIRRHPGMVIAAVLAALCALPIVPSNYWRRISSITDSSKDDSGSEASRRTLIRESVQAFTENPLTGVGAGQFKAWNPEHRDQAWHESHNVFLQVAAELGIAGLAAFTFLLSRAFLSVYQTRRLLRRIRSAASVRRWAVPGRRAASPAPDIPAGDAVMFDAYSAAMAASLAGWLVCAFFGSIAYNWTFYYLLALAATPRDMLRAHLPVTARTSSARRAALITQEGRA